MPSDLAIGLAAAVHPKINQQLQVATIWENTDESRQVYTFPAVPTSTDQSVQTIRHEPFQETQVIAGQVNTTEINVSAATAANPELEVRQPMKHRRSLDACLCSEILPCIAEFLFESCTPCDHTFQGLPTTINSSQSVLQYGKSAAQLLDSVLKTILRLTTEAKCNSDSCKEAELETDSNLPFGFATIRTWLTGESHGHPTEKNGTLHETYPAMRLQVAATSRTLQVEQAQIRNYPFNEVDGYVYANTVEITPETERSAAINVFCSSILEAFEMHCSAEENRDKSFNNYLDAQTPSQSTGLDVVCFVSNSMDHSTGGNHSTSGGNGTNKAIKRRRRCLGLAIQSQIAGIDERLESSDSQGLLASHQFHTTAVPPPSHPTREKTVSDASLLCRIEQMLVAAGSNQAEHGARESSPEQSSPYHTSLQLQLQLNAVNNSSITSKTRAFLHFLQPMEAQVLENPRGTGTKSGVPKLLNFGLALLHAPQQNCITPKCQLWVIIIGQCLIAVWMRKFSNLLVALLASAAQTLAQSCTTLAPALNTSSQNLPSADARVDHVSMLNMDQCNGGPNGGQVHVHHPRPVTKATCSGFVLLHVTSCISSVWLCWLHLKQRLLGQLALHESAARHGAGSYTCTAHLKPSRQTHFEGASRPGGPIQNNRTVSLLWAVDTALLAATSQHAQHLGCDSMAELLSKLLL
jgi:hypothetical protein